MNPTIVREYLSQLQNQVCSYLEGLDAKIQFSKERIQNERGFTQPRIITGGEVIEKAAVNLTHSIGSSLPKAATDRRPEMAGRPFQAVSMSLIVHPRNPYAPTTHANLRFFIAEGDQPIWWFGGGFDLTPFYGFEEDAHHWHKTAKKACAPFGESLYERLKNACDHYFYLPHRKEHRGIGGIFFEDFTVGGFEKSFSFVRSVGDHFLTAYAPILERRMNMTYSNRERKHQLYRRGRYVEFNLLYDRGTRYGLQSGRRIESVLASMPPIVEFVYDYHTKKDSEEERLLKDFLVPREWV